MTLTLVHGTLLTPDKELVDVIVVERETGDCHRAGLTVLEVKALLQGRQSGLSNKFIMSIRNGL